MLVPGGHLQGKQEPAWTGEMPVFQLRSIDCKYVPCGTPVYLPLCREAIHGLRNYWRTLQASRSGQP